MALQIRMLFGRQVPLDEICEKPDKIVAATFPRHQFTLTQNPEKLKLKPAYVGRAKVRRLA